MTPQELKASILQLAIQGKLVEQRPEEGSGGELLRDILTQRRVTAPCGWPQPVGTRPSRAEREPRGAECAEKNSRAEPRSRGERAASAASFGPSCPVSPDSPVLPADAPLDVPESWVWVRLGECISLLSGRDLEPSEYSSVPQRYPYMTGASNFADGRLSSYDIINKRIIFLKRLKKTLSHTAHYNQS